MFKGKYFINLHVINVDMIAVDIIKMVFIGYVKNTCDFSHERFKTMRTVKYLNQQNI